MKKLFSLLLAAALCLSCLCVPAMAADELSLKGTYAGGIVTVTGSGFTSNEDYPLISVKLPDVYPVAMDAKTANEDGRLELTVTTGTDNGGLDENPGKYLLVVRDNASVLVKQVHLTVNLSFDLGDGTASAALPTEIEGSTSYTLPGVSDVSGANGATLSKWKIGETEYEPGDTITEGFTVPLTTIAAVWTGGVQASHTVTFDLNGTEGTAPASQTVQDGQTVSRPTDPVREGFTFAAGLLTKPAQRRMISPNPSQAG